MSLSNGILPWTRTCFVCGENNPHGLHARSQWLDGRVCLDYVPREPDLGYRDIIHGGIGATLLDEVMTWAANIARQAPCVAAEFTVRLRGPLRVGQPVRVSGLVESHGGRLLLTTGSVVNGDGAVLMTAAGKYMPMRGEGARHCGKDFVHGPGTITPAQLFGERS